jgi:ATP-dependent protease ClpP protease subunit
MSSAAKRYGLQRGFVYLVGSVTDEPTNEDPKPSVVGSRIIDELLYLDETLPPTEPITILISSEGGHICPALAIQGTITLLRRQGRTVNGHVLGWAMSSAFEILQACDHRSMEAFASLMTHEVQSSTDGSTTTSEDEVKFSRQTEKRLFELFLESRSGKDYKYYKPRIKAKQWYLSAPEALAEGFVDEITSLPPFKGPKAPPAPKRPRKAKLVEAGIPSPDVVK